MNEPITAAVRLLVTPEADPQKAGRFTARLESTGEIVVHATRQPFVDGARELLARGFDPGTPLTMRHEGSGHDSFQPMPIGQWAGWTYTEGENTPLRCARWMPRPAVGEGQKSGSEPSVAPEGRETANRFRDGPSQGSERGYPEPTVLLGRVA
jgi:hypothetical protein